MTDELQLLHRHGPNKGLQAITDDSLKTQVRHRKRGPRATPAVVPLYSSTVIEISPTLIHNMPIVPPGPYIPPIPTFVPEIHSRDNRNARSSLAACLNLAPYLSMCQASLKSLAAMTRKLLRVSPVMAMMKQAYPTNRGTEIGEGGKGSHGGERYHGRGST